jgi:transketolase
MTRQISAALSSPDALDAGKFEDESRRIAELLAKPALDAAERRAAAAAARDIVLKARAETRRSGVQYGGYVAIRESAELTHILLATGSELSLAVAAAKVLGAGVRVVSLPSFERFKRQSSGYRESVIPAACRKRVAIEAGVTGLWYQFVGLDGKVIGIDRFGISAPGGTVMKELGITTEAVVAAAQSL